MSKNIKRRVRTNEEVGSVSIGTGVKFLGLEVLFSVIYLGIFALIATLFYPEEIMPVAGAYSAAFISSFAGGFLLSRKNGKAGLVTGCLAGLSYAFLLFLISLGVSDKTFFSAYKLIFLILSVIGGAFGGVVGMNFKPKRRR